MRGGQNERTDVIMDELVSVSHDDAWPKGIPRWLYVPLLIVLSKRPICTTTMECGVAMTPLPNRSRT